MNIREILMNAVVVPQIRLQDAAQALPLVKALLAGGLRVFEFSLHAKAGLAAIESVRNGAPEAIVGASGLNRAVDFAAAGKLNVHFGSSPGFTPELASAARGARFPLLPGVMTPSDVLAARGAGFHDMKFFPGFAPEGPGIMRQLAEEFPEDRFCPSGGLNAESARNYLRLPNVLSIGVDWLSLPRLVDASQWTEIESLAREVANYRRYEAGEQE